MSAARSERQRRKDHAGRPARIKAVTADLVADKTFYAEKRGVNRDDRD